MPWYAIDTLVRDATPVRIRWPHATGVAELIAERATIKKRGAVRRVLHEWYALRQSGQRMLLPPRVDASQTKYEGFRFLDEAGPDAWQPVDASRWADDLPEPLPESGVASQDALDAKYQAKLAAQTAARREREAAQAAAANLEARGGGQWWLDPGSIVYEPAGHVSPRMAEGRVMRAIWTLRTTVTLDASDRLTEGTTADWIATMVRRKAIETGEIIVAPRAPALFEASSRDISDCEVAYPWFYNLFPAWDRVQMRDAIGWVPTLNSWQQILTDRCDVPAKTWWEIAQANGETAKQAVGRYVEAMAAVHRLANGGPRRVGEVAPADPIEAVRARNQAYRLAASAREIL